MSKKDKSKGSIDFDPFIRFKNGILTLINLSLMLLLTIFFKPINVIWGFFIFTLIMLIVSYIKIVRTFRKFKEAVWEELFNG